MHGLLLACGKPVAAVSSVVNLGDLAILVKNYRYAVAVGCELAGKALVVDNECVVSCSGGRYRGVVKPSALRCSIGLAGADRDGLIGAEEGNLAEIHLLTEEVTGVKTYLTSIVALRAAVGEDNEGFALFKLGPSNCRKVSRCKVHGLLLACGKPVAAVSSVVNLGDLAILVKNYRYAVAVGCELAGKALVIYDNCVVSCSGGRYRGVVKPLALGSLILLAGSNPNEHRGFVSCALLSASGLGALGIGALAAPLTYTLALVSGNALALLSASGLGALSVGALATDLTNALALVSVSLALVSAYCVLTVGGALAALGADVLTLVRSLAKGKSGKGNNMTDGAFRVHGTVSESPCAGCVSTAVVGTDDKGFALCKLRPSGFCIVSGGEVNRCSLAISGIVAEVSTVVNLHESAVLVNNESRAVAVGSEGALEILIKYDNRVLGSGVSGYFCVIEEFTLLDGESLSVKLDLDSIGDNLNDSYSFLGVSSVCRCNNNSVLTNGIDVKAAVVLNCYCNGHVVRGIEGAVIVLRDKTCKNCRLKLEGGLANAYNDVLVLFNSGSLILVCSESLIAISPIKRYYVAVEIDNVVSHKSTAVSVKAISAVVSVACLYYYCKAACGNNHILSKII